MNKAFDRVTTALRDCVSVMERDLNGLAVIQPELAQAKKALDELDIVDADFIEWDGQGLPPVGAVEVMHFGHDQWTKQTINYIGGEDGMVVFKGNERGEFSCPVHSCQFRPLRTPEQIAAEEREKAAQAWLNGIEREYGVEVADKCESILFEAERKKTAQ